jgi:hypothetical protein
MWVTPSFYPSPLPETLAVVNRRDLYGGLRVKGNIGGYRLSLVSAQSEFQDLLGVSGNYAFDQWIPKLELGSVIKKNDPVLLYEKGQSLCYLRGGPCNVSG